MSTPTIPHGAEQLPDARRAEEHEEALRKKVQQRIWPQQVIALCGDIMQTFSSLRTSQRVNAVVATKTELEDIASDLKRVADCAAELSREFKQAAEAKR